jgi:ATP adenylyltransferase
MDRLWAPWRLDYAAAPKSPADDGCFVCRAAEANDGAHLVVSRTDLAVTILNRYPYNNGHLLVCPRAHKADPHELTDAETLELQRTMERLMAALRRTIRPDGFNVGLNLGRAAGAGVPGHLHWHVVPRWNGDVNFMPAIAGTKVIVQSLESLHELLTRELQSR